jgi:hypothetical protein
MPPPRRPVAPILERLIEGKVPKQIAAEFGTCTEAVTRIIRRHVEESGCKTILQAVAKYAREHNSANKPPDGVD